MALNKIDTTLEEYLSDDNLDLKEVEEYLSNDSLNYIEVTFKIFKIYYKTLPINEFLDIVFKYNKSRLFLKEHKGLATACYLKSIRVINEIFEELLIDAPINIKNIYKNRFNNLDNIIEVDKYIVTNFRQDPRFSIMQNLENYRRNLDIITAEYRKACNKDY